VPSSSANRRTILLFSNQTEASFQPQPEPAKQPARACGRVSFVVRERNLPQPAGGERIIYSLIEPARIDWIRAAAAASAGDAARARSAAVATF